MTSGGNPGGEVTGRVGEAAMRGYPAPAPSLRGAWPGPAGRLLKWADGVEGVCHSPRGRAWRPALHPEVYTRLLGHEGRCVAGCPDVRPQEDARAPSRPPRRCEGATCTPVFKNETPATSHLGAGGKLAVPQPLTQVSVPKGRHRAARPLPPPVHQLLRGPGVHPVLQGQPPAQPGGGPGAAGPALRGEDAPPRSAPEYAASCLQGEGSARGRLYIYFILVHFLKVFFVDFREGREKHQ